MCLFWIGYLEAISYLSFLLVCVWGCSRECLWLVCLPSTCVCVFVHVCVSLLWCNLVYCFCVCRGVCVCLCVCGGILSLYVCVLWMCRCVCGAGGSVKLCLWMFENMWGLSRPPTYVCGFMLDESSVLMGFVLVSAFGWQWSQCQEDFVCSYVISMSVCMHACMYVCRCVCLYAGGFF